MNESKKLNICAFHFFILSECITLNAKKDALWIQKVAQSPIKK